MKNMKKQRHVSELNIYLYNENGLSLDERIKIGGHLGDCDRCASILFDMRHSFAQIPNSVWREHSDLIVTAIREKFRISEKEFWPSRKLCSRVH